MLCGNKIGGEALSLSWKNREVFVSTKKLEQWSRFHPEKIDPNKFGD